MIRMTSVFPTAMLDAGNLRLQNCERIMFIVFLNPHHNPIMSIIICPHFTNEKKVLQWLWLRWSHCVTLLSNLRLFPTFSTFFPVLQRMCLSNSLEFWMLIRFSQLDAFMHDLQGGSETEAIFLLLQAGKFKGRCFFSPSSNILIASFWLRGC